MNILCICSIIACIHLNFNTKTLKPLHYSTIKDNIPSLPQIFIRAKNIGGGDPSSYNISNSNCAISEARLLSQGGSKVRWRLTSVTPSTW